MTKTTTIIASAALALSLTACGSGSTDAGSGDKATSPAASATGNTSSATAQPSTGTGGTVPDEQWAAKFKTVIPPMANTSDAEIVTAGKKICTTFTADPTPATAKAIIKDAETTFKLDSVQANMWAGGAVSHFCNDQGTTFLSASVG
ncbi:hypothetical protein V6K52_03125 [Knoellia sp. S7-12]|uniref:DUF732 domain-containing protein n=1 Tax=Knoellia sp. S7-12 TaxID=3126698 RepID=UPI00336828DB